MDKEFVENIIAAQGTKGQQLLDRIPEIIRKYEERWSIKVLVPFKLSYNYVASATSADGSYIVFKIGLHGHDEFAAEHDSLKVFNGEGIIRLLNSDTGDDVMLLEKAEPGVPLSEIKDDEKATRVIVLIIKQLPKSAPPEIKFATLQDWFKGFERLKKKFNGTAGPLPEKMVREGQELYQYLIDTSTEQFLLHGDLHHDNILSATRQEWLAIDPDAVVGERAHETAAMLRNPQPYLSNATNLKAILSRRIAIMSEELGIERERIRQWGIAQNVLSAIWKIEDGGKDWFHPFNIAETISTLKL